MSVTLMKVNILAKLLSGKNCVVASSSLEGAKAISDNIADVLRVLGFEASYAGDQDAFWIQLEDSRKVVLFYYADKTLDKNLWTSVSKHEGDIIFRDRARYGNS